MSMGISSAFAITISVERDASYTDNGDDTANTNGGRAYTWYKVFSASYATTGDDAFDGTEFEGGHTNGVANTETGDGVVSYTATSTVAAKLGSWVAATGTPGEDDYVAAHWEKATGNNWFELTPIAGTTNYSVKWVGSANPDADEVQAAADWLKTKGAYETTGSLTWDSATKTWKATGLAEGYYVLSSDTGDNLVAATSDIAVKEKNDYPPQDKTQADEDDTTPSDTTRDVAIGDVLTYEVKVTVPKTAKVGERILVWDKQSKGLTYNDNAAVKAGTNTGNAGIADATGEDIVSGAAWTKVITITEASKGTDIVFTFTMTVNSDALVDTDKKNESGIKYGNENDWTYTSLPDKVEYKTYFAGIHKYDGADTTKDLEGVKFTLKEAGTEFKVSKPTGKDYYIPDANGSSEVVTDASGLIKIRGLDEDKTYTLTETETLPGYNKLAEDVTLTLHLDTATSTTTTEGGETTTTVTEAYNEVTSKTDTKWGPVVNNKGTELPSTGGIGTTIFYVVGSILVVAAGVLLITKKRMSREG